MCNVLDKYVKLIQDIGITIAWGVQAVAAGYSSTAQAVPSPGLRLVGVLVLSLARGVGRWQG